nr:immunoglobulin heavy chain junction region [Mus musculus]
CARSPYLGYFDYW